MSPHLFVILIISVFTLILMFWFSIRNTTQKLQEQTKKSPTNIAAFNTSSKIMELIDRFQFLAGKNRDHFEHLLQTQQFKKAEQFLTQRFKAQKKQDPQQLAHHIMSKLLKAVSPTDPPISPPSQYNL